MKKKYFQLGVLSVGFLLISILLFIRNYDFSNSFIVTEKVYSKIEVGSTESCLQCHQKTTGYSDYHNPELIGCSSCHLGDISSLDKTEAHKGMILIPGNLADAEMTCGKCHI